MSFILDALKKSESDRQRQSGPSLFEVKVAPPRRTLPIWAVAIAVLLGINAIVVSWMLLRHAPAQQPAAASPATAPPVASAARNLAPATPPGAVAPAPSAASAAGATLPSAAPATLPPAPASSAAASPAGSSQPPPGSAAPLAGGNPSDYAPAVEPAAAPDSGASAGSTGTEGDLPLYQQIVTSDGLPALHLDLHVFAKSPRDRFVMINMQRLGEGDSLPNGVQVVAIRPDGAVLSYHGTRFLLPRE